MCVYVGGGGGGRGGGGGAERGDRICSHCLFETTGFFEDRSQSKRLMLLFIVKILLIFRISVIRKIRFSNKIVGLDQRNSN